MDIELNTIIPNIPGTSPAPVGEVSAPEPIMSDFANGILSQIPEEDRGTVGKYLNTWDGNVTKQFQKIHDEYKPYKDLGALPDVQNAIEYMQMLNTNPIEFISLVQQALKESGVEMSDYDGYEEPVQQIERSVLPEWEGVPQAFVDRFSQMEEMISQLNDGFGNFTQGYTEREQIQQIDNLFKEMHNVHGAFDEDYVLLKMSAGMDPDQALNSWNDTISKYSSQRKPAPMIMGGPGGVPNGQVDFSTLSKAEKMAHAVAAIQNANANN